ncbi:STM4012 family radical SAM protein [Leucothrix pacifica]|nr:STM4012 family radical SAM protein [Leucothrix pacifica]
MTNRDVTDTTTTDPNVTNPGMINAKFADTFMTEQATRLSDYLAGKPYLNYVYSYPHKTSYRDFETPRSLRDYWADEDKRSLFLYLHIPFCEMRCGYCNLFTTTNPEQDLVTDYLAALERQVQVTAEFLQHDFHFEQLAFGGGTPSYLLPEQLQSCFDLLEQHLQVKQLPASVEVSPATADHERLAVLKAAGVERISMGVESFDAADLKALGRPQTPALVDSALHAIKDSGIPRLNIDLIYGSANQSLQSWLYSVDQALAWSPEEIFIYPLYIRPLTGLGRKARQETEDQRLTAYFAARERLLDAGYEQSSMRMFTRSDAPAQTGRYRCQEEGMIGLGAGARSYTRSLHYSGHYAVTKPQIRQIIQDYINTPSANFAQAHYGIEIGSEDQRRRYVLLGLLQVSGIAFDEYQQQFQRKLLEDIPQLTLLVDQGLAVIREHDIRLTEKGIAYSDLIGSWLFTNTIRDRMQAWEWQ